MRNFRALFEFAIATLAFFTATTLRAEEIAERVVVLANRADSDSVRLAHYYAEQRHVPVENIFEFAMPLAETVSWPEFVSSVWQPLQDQLIARHWIDAVGSSLRDEAGRKKYAINGHRVAYLVVCRGVPLRIGHDPSLAPDPPPPGLPPAFQTNQAAVDSELALLAENHPAINGFVPNPLFQQDAPSELARNRVIKISRLDGPTYDDAQALIDHALAAERTGLMGRAYVDIGGLHPEGDRWLEKTVTEIAQLGFDLEIDREPHTFPDTTRSDAPALYFGWYAQNLNGPFALPGFRFPPGAIALHIHSFSAQTLRSVSDGWTGPLVVRGVTATVGNVFEPYLELTHRPDLLMHALAHGANFGDAVAYACPAFSWQAIAIGDPLFRPFAVSVERQIDRFDSPLASYAVLRMANFLEKQNHSDEARALLQREMKDHASWPLALALASRLETANERVAAAALLSSVGVPETLSPDQWALAREVAEHLSADGSPTAAVGIFRRLLAAPVPANIRSTWLREACDTAVAADDVKQAEVWRTELGDSTSTSEKK